MPSNPRPRTSLVIARLSDQIHDAVRSEISDGRLAPGERIIETELARSFGVSQAPVRDALRRLAHEGLVLQLPRRGTYVAEISDDEARRSYLVREALEDVAAREFCAHAADDVFAELQACVERMYAAARSADLPELILADIEFHRTVWEASGNPLLPRMWPLVEPSLRGFTAVSNKVYFQLDEVASSHVPLLDALRARDAGRAALESRAHVNAVWGRIGSDEARTAGA